MPGRNIPLVNNQVYHILNRGVFLQPIFKGTKDFQRAIELIKYYQNQNPPLRYSQFLFLSTERREQVLKDLVSRRECWVEIICFCLMPNHFHFILKQIKKEGISRFISNFTNSYTRYFNAKYQRTGHLLQGRFKAIRVETDEQLLHLSRYIHLNPYSSGLVKTIKELEEYPWSSLPEYLGKRQLGFCNKEIVLNQFRYPKQYQEFVFNQADYQRKLERIKHLVLGDE